MPVDNSTRVSGELRLSSSFTKPPPLAPVSNNNQASLPKDMLSFAHGLEKMETKPRRMSNAHYHQKLLLQSAKTFCVEKEFVDVHLKCQDGTIAAHSLVLAISPFLHRLLMSKVESSETAVILLPDTKVGVVQTLLEFLYTGTVSLPEARFCSLVNLLRDLGVNAAVEAERTAGPTTQIDISPINNYDINSQSFHPKKRARIDTFDSTFNALFDSSTNVQTNSKNVNLSSQDSLWAKSGGLVVNSLTASGVEVKQEPEEKPVLQEDQSGQQHEQSDLRALLNKTSFDISSTINTLSSNTVNNNQLGHFVAVNPGYQVKLEVPTTSVGHLLSPPSPPPVVKSKQCSSNPDDPLAAIMNQTIFGGDGNMSTMYISVNGTSGFVNENKKIQPTSMHKKPVQVTDKDKEPGPVVQQHQENNEETPCLPDDDDHNTSYNCDSCNRVMKGKVMLQAHKFQEHHENPDFESRSFPDDKFACRVCLKLFTRNSDVKAHILRVHCGDRRYPCTLCGKRFKESTHLRKHLYTHTGERPHFCSFCSKGFQTSSDLKRHKKTRVHQERVDQCNNDKASGGTNTDSQTDKGVDSGLDYPRWNDADDEDLEYTLSSASGSPFSNLSQGTSQPSNSTFSNMNPARSQTKTAPTSITSARTQASNFSFSSLSLSREQPKTSTFTTLNLVNAQPQTHSFSGHGAVRSQQQATPSFNPDTTLSSAISTDEKVHAAAVVTYSSPASQFVQLPSRLSNNAFNSVPSPTHQVHFSSEPLSKQTWQPHSNSGVMQQSLADSQLGSVSLTSSPLADVLSTIPAQSLGVQNLALPSTTLDLSDIKWGILDPTVTIKRSGSTDSPAHGDCLTIQEDI